MKSLIPSSLLRSVAYTFVALFLFLSVGAGSLFAQAGTTFYVSTSGNNLWDGSSPTFQGGNAGPKLTLSAAITAAGANATISVAAGDYSLEAVSVGKVLSFQATSSGAFTQAQFGTLAISANANFVADGDGTFRFSTLTLTSGAATFATGKVTLTSDVTRVAGTLTGAPTFATNTSVTYTGAAKTAGDELPSSMGTGTLTVNLGAPADVLTIGKNVSMAAMTLTQGSVNAPGNSLTLSGAASGTGNVTAGTLAAGSVNVTGNVTAGTITSGAFTATGAVSATTLTASGNVILSGAASSIGTLTVNNADITLNHNLTGNVVHNQNLAGGTARNFTLAATHTLTGSYTANKTATTNTAAFGLVTINGTVTGNVSLTDASRGPLSSNNAAWPASVANTIVSLGNSAAVNGTITLVENVDNQVVPARQGTGRIVVGTGVTIGGAVNTPGGLTLAANSGVTGAVNTANLAPETAAGFVMADYVTGAILTLDPGSEITGNVVSGGNATLTGTAKVTGDFSFSALTGNPARTLTNSSDSEITGTLTINRAGTTIASTEATITVPTAPGSKFGSLNVSSAVTFPGGTIAGGINSSAALTLSGNTVVNDVTSSGGFTLIALKTLNARDITLAGVSTLGGVVNARDITTTTGTSTFNAVLDARDITITGASEFTAAVDARTVSTSANMTLANTMTLTGNFTRSAGSFTGTAGTLAFTGATNAVINPGPNFSLVALTVNKPGATLDIQGSIVVSATAAPAFTVTGATTTVQLNANTIRVSGTGQVSNAGSILVTSNQGGLVFATAAATIQGLNYSNIFVEAAITLTGNTSFTGTLTIASGSVATGANDLSPVNDNQLVIINRESSTGVDATGGTFNAADKLYNIEYIGVLTTDKVMGSELTNRVNNITVNTTNILTNDAIQFPNANYTVNGDLTVKAGAKLKGTAGAHTITLKGRLIVEGTSTLEGKLLAGAGLTTFDLDTEGLTHTVSGTIEYSGLLRIRFVKANTTIAGSGVFTASRNLIGADIEVRSTGAAITGIQQVQRSIVVDNTTNTSLTLTLINSAAGTPVTPGAVGGGITLGGSATGNATLTLGSNVNLAGTLTTHNRSTLNFGAFDLKSSVASPAFALTNSALPATNAVFASTGGYLIVDGVAGVIDAASASIPYLRIAAAASLTSALTVSQMLDVKFPLTGAQTLTIGGNANLDANVTNNVIFTATAGTGTIALGAADRTITGTATLNSDNGISITGTTSSRALIVTGLFTQTKGALGLNNSGLLLDANYVFTAGSVTATTGYIQMNTGAPATLTANAALSIPNLRLNVATSMAGSSMLTVSDNLVLIAGTFTNTVGAPAVNRVTIGAGATIERRANTAVFSAAPAFGGTANLLYTTAGTIATSFEAPASASVINNMTADVAVNIDKNLTVNGTLTLRAALDRVVAVPAHTLTMASGATIDLFTATGSMAFAPTATLYNLRYRTTRAIGFEFVGTQASVTVDDGAATSPGITVTAGAARTMASLTLGQNDVFDNGVFALTVNGVTSLNPGASVSGTAAFSITGNLSVMSATSLATASNIVFNGTTAQTLSVPVGTTLALTNVTLNNAAGLTLSGGNMSTSGTFTFTSGLLRTGASNALILTHTSTSNQGFTRPNSGHVVGNVTKTLPSAGTASNRVTFPVGAQNETNRAYSPVSFTFNSPDQIPAGITMTVSHDSLVAANAVDQLGKNGFPIPDGVRAGVGLARYPDSFYWTVKTSSPLSASLAYDMELERENYNAYCLQPGVNCTLSDVEDLRIIRRAGGNNPNNPWRLQGAANQYLQSFQTTNSGNTHPTVIVTNVEGGILSGDGTIFTYALKSNMVATTPAALTANVGQTRKVALRTAFTGGTSGYRYMVSGNTAATATGVVAQDTLTITAAGVGSTSFTVLATDSLNDSRQITVDITVNAGITTAPLANMVLNNGSSRVVDIANLFTGGSAPIARVVSSSNVAAATAAISGNNLTVTSVGAGTATITVTGTDATSAVASVSFTVTVNAAFTTAGTITGSTLRAADGVAGGQAAGTQVLALGPLFIGGTAPVAYTAVSADVAAATVSITGANLTVTAVRGNLTAATTQISLSAVDSLGATLTRTFDVTVLPALGDVDGNAEIDFADARTILRANVGLVTLNAVQLVVADVNNSGTVNSFDASVVLRYPLPGSGISIPYVAPKRNDAAAGKLAWGEFTRDTKASTITVPVMISNASGVYSVDFAGEFDVNTTSVVSIDLSELPQDWMSSTNVTEDGQIRIALAGSSSLVNALVANVTFAIDADSPLSVKANGFVNADSFVMESLEVEQLPLEFALGQNYPNPFNPTTSIRYQLPMSADVTIELYNMLGQRVMTLVNGTIQAGTHTISADFSKLSSGVYVYRIQARGESESFVSTRTMTLIK